MDNFLSSQDYRELSLPSNIESLSLVGFPLKINELNQISQLKRLKILNLDDCTGLCSTGLSFLSKHSLESLSVHNTRANEKCLEQICKMKTLERLGIMHGNNKLIYGSYGMSIETKLKLKKEFIVRIRKRLPNLLVN